MSRALPAWADPERVHRNNFDFIRLVLAVLVVYSHSYPLVDPKGLVEPLSRLLPGYTFGGLAVDGFFLISGYLITQSWVSRPELGAFLLKRVRRIYPGFVAMMIVLAIGMVPLVRVGPKAMWRGVRVQEWLMTTVTLGPYARVDALRGVPVIGLLNGSTWTIRFEFLCYVLLAAGMFTRVLALRWVALGAWAAGMCAWMMLAERGWAGQELDGRWLRDLLIGRMGLPLRWDGRVDLSMSQLGYIGGVRFAMVFLAGAVFYQWRRSIPQRWWLAGLSAAAWVWVSWHWGQQGATYISAAVFLPYVFFWLAFVPVRGLHRFARLGDFSYGTYLYAWPIQQLTIKYVPGIGPWGLFAASAPLAVVMGVLSWHGVEKHFLRCRHRPRGDAPAAWAEPAQEATVAK